MEDLGKHPMRNASVISASNTPSLTLVVVNARLLFHERKMQCSTLSRLNLYMRITIQQLIVLCSLEMQCLWLKLCGKKKVDFNEFD